VSPLCPEIRAPHRGALCVCAVARSADSWPDRFVATTRTHGAVLVAWSTSLVVNQCRSPPWEGAQRSGGIRQCPVLAGETPEVANRHCRQMHL